MDYGRFTNPEVLRAIGRELLREFVARFAGDLEAKKAVCPAEILEDGDYYAAWSAAFTPLQRANGAGR